jgi:exodeoxyribonuclease VII large subunit
MPVLLVPVAVQGEGAAQEIAHAIEALNAARAVDVMLVGRGGGSIVDLWPFNEELVARAIFASEIPVVSCVGHEVDFCIADFVSDVRAATPSVAAELAVPVCAEVRETLLALGHRAQTSLAARIALEREKLARLSQAQVMRGVSALIARRREEVLRLRERLRAALAKKTDGQRHGLKILEAKLNAIDPRAVLFRGYAYLKKDGRLLDDIEDVSTGDRIRAVVKNGVIGALVEMVDEGESHA